MEVNNQFHVSFSLSGQEASLASGWQADWATHLMSEPAGDERREKGHSRQTDTWNSWTQTACSFERSTAIVKNFYSSLTKLCACGDERFEEVARE
jgi:hypothetical protein